MVTLRSPRGKHRPFMAGDVVDVMVAKGLNPNGGWARGTIEADVSSQFGRSMFLVAFEGDEERPPWKDIVHELRFALVEAVGHA